MTISPPLLRWLLCSLCAIAALGELVGAAEPAGEEGAPAEPLRFIRVYAPAERVTDWPRGNVKYVPVEADEFERLLTSARRAGDEPRGAVCGLSAARYTARLSEGSLVDGTATLDVYHSAPGGVLLPLAGCGLAVRNARWVGEKQGPATLGLAEDGKTQLLVEGEGRLELDWSLRGESDASGATRFSLRLPPCPVNRLSLELPEGLTPATDHGIALPTGAPAGGLRQWEIELGGHHRTTLRLMPAEVPENYRRLILLRQSMVYDFTRYGVEVAVRLQLDIHNEPLRQAVLLLDPRLQLVSARYGEAALAWTANRQSDGKRSQVVIELPEPLQGTGRVLRLAARAPLQLDKPWRLPTLRMAGASWQEGSATLIVPAPLSLRQLLPVGCRQSKTAPLPASRSGESAELQYFSPLATARVVLAEERSSLEIDCGSSVELSGREMAGEVRANLSTTDGEHFAVEAEVGPRWLIDSVESIPAEAIEDWSSERSASGPGRIAIRLARPITPERPVQLRISGRRIYSPLGRTLGVADLVPVRFGASSAGRRLVSLRTSDSAYQLELSGDERMPRLDPSGLKRADLELFAEPPRSLVFEDDARAEPMRVLMVARRPTYAASAEVEVLAAHGTLTENYRLECIPEAARVDRVLIQFSTAREEPIHWTLGGSDDRQLSAVRLDPTEEAEAGLPAGGESWEVHVRPSRSGRFEIHGSRSMSWTDEEPVGLVWLPEATQQQATLTIRSDGPTPVEIVNRRLVPVPPETAASDRCPTARAAFRYDPPRDALPRPQASVSIAPSGGEDVPPGAWIWLCRLRSRYETDGAGRHIATLRLQSTGAERLEITLPEEAAGSEVTGVWLDRTRVAWRASDGQRSDGLEIDLPPGKRFPVVSLHFATSGPPLGDPRGLQPPMPEADIPILARHWTVWLPPGYRAADRSLPGLSGGSRPLNASQRLFGPLGRPPGVSPFDPLDLDDWTGLIRARPERARSRRRGEQLLQAIAGPSEKSTSKQPAERVDWGTLLSRESIDRLGLTVLVDQRALAEAGVTPGSLAPMVDDPRPTERGAAIVRQSGLALLLHGEAVLVTTAIDAAVYRAHLKRTGGAGLWHVERGPLADQMREATVKASPLLMAVETWRDEPEPSPLPWAETRLAGYEPVDNPGWTACRVELPDSGDVRLEVVHRDRMRTYLWVSLLAAASAAWWFLKSRPVLIAILTGLAGLAALLLPEPYLALATGTALGGLCCLVAWTLRRRSDAADASTVEHAAELPTTIAKPTSAVGGLLLAVALLTSGELRAEDPPAVAASPGTDADVQRVFIPTGADEKPNGDRYQVPESLYRHLRRQEKSLAQQLQGWLLTGATYRGEFVWQTSPNRLVLSKLKAVFDLDMLGAGTRVRIPFGRDGANLLPGGVLLDGRAIEPEWEEDGRMLAFSVPEAAKRYRLELALRPTVQSGGVMAGLKLSVPRLANSRLELSTPHDAPAIEIPSAVGAVTTAESETRKVVVDLGPTDSLEMRWQEGAGPVTGGPAVDVQELLWLRVRPGSVVIDARFKLNAIQGDLAELRLAADPRLRLLPLPGEDPPTVRSSGTVDGPQSIQLQFSRPFSEKQIALSFLVTDTSGVGNLRLPVLESSDARVTRRWLAVSVDPSLDFPEPAPDRTQAVGVPDFLAAWGESEQQPRFVDDLASDETPWSMRTQPRAPRTTAAQVLALSFAKRSVLVQFEASLETTSGYVFQYRLTVPKNLQVEEVTVSAGGQTRAARWARGPDGRINVFLTGPLAGSQKFLLVGRMPVAASGPTPLPRLEIEGAEVESRVFEIFRQSDVLVRLAKKSGLAEDPAPAVGEDKQTLGSLVARLRDDGTGDPSAALVHTVNRPKVEAQQITSLAWDGGGWEASVDLSLSVSRGIVDTLRLEIPASWSASLKTNPPAAVEVVDTDDPAVRELRIRPHSGIDGQYRIRISGPVATKSGQPVTAPNVELLGVARRERFLVLPTQRQLEPITWDTEGLEETPLPEAFPKPPVAAESYAAYRVIEKDFRASLRPLDEDGEIPTVRQADIRIAWRADGTCYGVALFDLVPAGLSQCLLEMPDGYRLTQVHVDGLPTVATAMPERRWRVSLSSERLPQRVEVLFVATLPQTPPEMPHQFDAPRLGDLPVKRLLWTISGPPSFGPGEPSGAGPCSALQQAVQRLRTVAALIELGARLAGDHPEETARWYRTWARRYQRAASEVRRELVLPPETGFSRTARAELQAIDRTQARVAEQLGLTAVREKVAAESVPAAEPEELWARTLGRHQPATRCEIRGPARPIHLQYRPSTDARFAEGIAAAVLLIAGLLLAILVLRGGPGAGLACRWPHLVGVAVGLAWWLWLWPSIFGWAIVLASLLLALWPGWTSPRNSSSLVVSLGSRAR